MSLFSSIFGNEPTLASKTVDGVMSAFHDTIAKLRDVAEHHNAKADEHKAAIEVHSELAAASEAEAQRAEQIAAKLSAVVTADVADNVLPVVKLAA
ncbi:hypothetical protein [Paraburkholderia sp.]|uniref:hypothetical protein n=1 Tax=Paraburkholderia sp. TaxID=1926495 RepID=UPI0039E5C221